MVERMVTSDLSKYGLGKSPNIINNSNNQQISSSLNDTKLSDSNNDNEHLDEDSALQKEDDVTQAKSPARISNVNLNLVYARRKSDAELNNSRTNSDKNHITTSEYQQAEQKLDDKNNNPEKANESSAHISVVNLSIEMENWHARFAQLQKYLKQCDTSNQEVYLQKLRAFSPDECSRHAVELEKRAIKLTFDEGTEIQRVKDLNMFGGNHYLRHLTPVYKSGNLV
ncbi:uncharacterized protein [Rutidosis leptorrhynchoides]|uniref:uncharacterized protein n=1 Tax=Rutidosis leptorrhynchoides TaxID=125765 RepID=UPI003A9A007D